MPDRDSFIAAIAAAPDDDLPRLVFADWLDEHGEGERAEFVRGHIALAHAEPGQRAELYDHWHPLFDLNTPTWLKPFVAALGLNLPAAQHPEGFWRRLFGGRQRPVQRPLSPREVRWAHTWDHDAKHVVVLQVGQGDGGIHSGVVRRGFLDHLSIIPSCHHADCRFAEAIRHEPVFSLAVMGGGTADDWRRADGEHWRRMSRLTLMENPTHRGEDRTALTRAVFHSPHLTGVRTLAIHDDARAVTDELPRSPLACRLTELTVANCPQVVRSLQPMPADAPLRTLRLSNCGSLSELHTLPFRDRLVALDLGGHPQGWDEEAFLNCDAAWAELRLLDLAHSRISTGQFQPLCSSAGFPALRELFLADCWFEPELAAVLAAAPFLPQLEVLDLSNNRFGDREVLAVADRLDPNRLRRLDVRHLPLSLRACEELVFRFGDRLVHRAEIEVGNPGWG